MNVAKEGQMAVSDDDEVQPMTLAQLQEKIDSDADFRDQYLENPTKYEAAIVQSIPEGPQDQGSQGPGEQDDSTGDPQGQPAKPPADSTPDEVVTVKLPKSLLNSYGVNRSGENAVVEALKGITEKDTVISYLRKRLEEAGGEKMNLKQEIERYKTQTKPEEKKPEEIPAKPADKKGDIEDFDFESLSEDAEEIFDPDKAPAIIRAIKNLARQNKELKSQQQEIGQTANKVLTSAREKESQAAQSQSITNEIREIEDMFIDAPELRPAVPFQQLDISVAQFIRDVGYVAGTGGGEYNQAATEAANRYFHDKTPQGDELRKKCAESGIKPPDEINKHSQIISIRSERKKYMDKQKQLLSSKLGRQVEDYEVEIPFTYTDFYHRLRKPSEKKELLQARVEGAQQVGREVEKLKGAAKELPPETGNTGLVLENLKPGQIGALIAKPKNELKPEEEKVLRQWYVSQQIPYPYDPD